MIAKICRSFIAAICFCILTQTVWAAPDSPVVQKVRYFAAADKVRVVIDLSAPVQYKASQPQDTAGVLVELDTAANQSGFSKQELNDPAIAGIRLVNEADGKLRLAVDCRQPVSYKVFTLANPQRLVIDVFRMAEYKLEQDIRPGVHYTSWFKPGAVGPLSIFILDIGPKSGYALQPVLIRGDVLGTDPLSRLMQRGDVLAAVNASYFEPNGDIIGLLKINDEIISSSALSRTALGVMMDGKMMIDQTVYHGEAVLTGGQKLPFDGVNEERGTNGLILYNRFYGPVTGTNVFGMEYTIIAGAVAAIQQGNSPIPANGCVLSAHGETAKKLAGLKVGDSVQVNHTMGKAWDEAQHVLGAGPMLVKQGNVFLTTKTEEFGSDVAGGRAPRTAVGLTKDGRVLLVVVDGRQEMSKGMTLLELALFMRELGATEAMNLDGGGSSEMIVGGRVVNKPSDGRERRVGSGLAVVPMKLAI